MSHSDYTQAQTLVAEGVPFRSLIMAAMHSADANDLSALGKAFPEIRSEKIQRDNSPGGRLIGEHLEDRPFSRDPRHQEDDLRASLSFVRNEGLIDAVAARAIIETFRLSAAQPGRSHAQNELRLLAEENPLAFGLACRFHIEAKTSLMGDAEAVSSMALARMGLTVGDLGWPESVSNSEDATDEDPGLESRLSAAISAWKLAHADD